MDDEILNCLIDRIIELAKEIDRCKQEMTRDRNAYLTDLNSVRQELKDAHNRIKLLTKANIIQEPATIIER
jgi:hypothetical protein